VEASFFPQGHLSEALRLSPRADVGTEGQEE
jgi:hypothetical protein